MTSIASQRRTRKMRMSILPRAAWWVVSICLAILFLYPISVMLSEVGLDDVAKLTDSSRGLSVVQSLGNSLFVSLTATAVTLVASTLAGYAFAKLPYRGSRIAFFITLVTFMIPFQAVVTPLYIVLRDIGLQNNLLGVALVLATFNLPLGIFLMRNSFAAIPSSLEEAAQIDGATWWQTQRHITIPLLGPTIRIWAFLSIIGSLQLFDMVWILTGGGPVNATTTMATYMVQYGFQRSQLGYGSAVAVILFIVSLIFALLYQRFILRRDFGASLTRGVS